MRPYDPFVPDDLRRFVMGAKLRLVVRNFRCACGACDDLYLAPAEAPESSSVTLKSILEALGLKEGDVLVVHEEPRGPGKGPS